MANNAFDRFRVVDYFDSPEVLDCSVTPIPGSGSAPLEVVHSLAAQVHQISFRDGIQTEYIGLFAGPAGAEEAQPRAIIGGNGQPWEFAAFQKGERVSIRSMNPASITAGQLVVHFVGNA